MTGSAVLVGASGGCGGVGCVTAWVIVAEKWLLMAGLSVFAGTS